MHRRFVPIEVHHELAIPALIKVRDKVWAEALHLYREGARANMNRGLAAEAEAQADKFRIETKSKTS